MSLGLSSEKTSGMEKGRLHIIRHGRMEVSVRRGGTWCERDNLESGRKAQEECTLGVCCQEERVKERGESMRHKPFPAPLLTKPRGVGKDPRGAFKGAHYGEGRSTQTQPPGDSSSGSNIKDRRDWRPYRTECGHLVNKHNAQNSKVKFKLAKLTVKTQHGGEKSFCQMFM